MKKLAIIAMLAICYNCALFANNFYTDDSFGVVVLKSGESFQGTISYHFKQDLVLIENAAFGKKALTPDKVTYFRFYDENIDRERVFTSLDIPNKYGYLSTGFYEVLITGDMTVIGKLKSQFQTSTEQEYYGYAKTQAEKVKKANTLYDMTVIIGSDLHHFSSFKKTLLPLMTKEYPEIKELVQAKKMYFKSDDEKLEVIELYNKLNTSDKGAFASATR
ncbi:hypothetical protein R9C00_25855 [Flammeovirgaceae bacterium SG7u.111]|nr:hypothetical protein [Flammeovirgaceae bacterium SG7u.132]WPO35123.1 hypothetical protein R9C00_25855 [Flammeovirgaceae bacterium SG7u.111]